MSARLDRQERRALLAEAVWRLVQREGLRGASVRGVASETGLSMGSVRHFFATQEELLLFAMRTVIDSAAQRIADSAAQRQQAVTEGRSVDAAIDLLGQVLPLDSERLTEARVWSAFAGQALSDPAMGAIRKEADDAVREMCRQCLVGLVALDQVATDRDLDLETERLHALIDGLTLHLLSDPDRLPADKVRDVLRDHLSDLSRPRLRHR